jgi:hypothetical protein
VTTETVQKVIIRAVTEPEFRDLLFRDSAQALSGYDLTGAEVDTLGQLSREAFDAAAASLEERSSKAGFSMLDGGSSMMNNNLMNNMLNNVNRNQG